jgi:dihydropteroate synthase
MRAIPELWGVLNVTPDSFSDGGLHFDVDAATMRVRELLLEGADVIDVGGESTRPPGRAYGAGYADVAVDEELRRVIPVIEAAVADGARVSIDTTKVEVAARALEAGASVVNHVGERASDTLLAVVAERSAGLVLMHNRGRGQAAPEALASEDLVREVCEGLLREAERAVSAGVAHDRIWLDPGIGFAKSADQSAELMRNLPILVATGYPILVGASRKSFIAEIAGEPGGRRPAPSERLGGSLAAAIRAFESGVKALRIHDVGATRQALIAFAAFHRHEDV